MRVADDVATPSFADGRVTDLVAQSGHNAMTRVPEEDQRADTDRAILIAGSGRPWVPGLSNFKLP